MSDPQNPPVSGGPSTGAAPQQPPATTNVLLQKEKRERNVAERPSMFTLLLKDKVATVAAAVLAVVAGAELAEICRHEGVTVLGVREGRPVDASAIERAIADLVKALVAADIAFNSFDVHQSSLEDIFVDLVERKPA